ncbi:hypothetical protein DIPPA_05971 [Diplonema papillatum]|nr:hypothetical protein DIPPA_05971 [Diplonema papillatum]
MDDGDGPACPKKAPDRPNLSHLSPRRSASPLLGAARVGSASHPASCAGDPSLGVFAALQHHVVGKDDVVVQLKRQLAARDRQLAEATTDARTSRLRHERALEELGIVTTEMQRLQGAVRELNTRLHEGEVEKAAAGVRVAADADSRIQALHAQLQRAAAQRQQLTGEYLALKDEKRVADGRAAGLAAALADARAQTADLQQRHRALELQGATTTARLAGVEPLLEAKAAEAKALQREVARLEGASVQSADARTVYRGSSGGMEAALKKGQADFEALRREADRFEQLSEDLQEQVDSLQRQLHEQKRPSRSGTPTAEGARHRNHDRSAGEPGEAAQLRAKVTALEKKLQAQAHQKPAGPGARRPGRPGSAAEHERDRETAAAAAAAAREDELRDTRKRLREAEAARADCDHAAKEWKAKYDALRGSRPLAKPRADPGAKAAAAGTQSLRRALEQATAELSAKDAEARRHEQTHRDERTRLEARLRELEGERHKMQQQERLVPPARGKATSPRGGTRVHLDLRSLAMGLDLHSPPHLRRRAPPRRRPGRPRAPTTTTCASRRGATSHCRRAGGGCLFGHAARGPERLVPPARGKATSPRGGTRVHLDLRSLAMGLDSHSPPHLRRRAPPPSLVSTPPRSASGANNNNVCFTPRRDVTPPTNRRRALGRRERTASALCSATRRGVLSAFYGTWRWHWLWKALRRRRSEKAELDVSRRLVRQVRSEARCLGHLRGLMLVDGCFSRLRRFRARSRHRRANLALLSWLCHRSALDRAWVNLRVNRWRARCARGGYPGDLRPAATAELPGELYRQLRLQLAESASLRRETQSDFARQTLLMQDAVTSLTGELVTQTRARRDMLNAVRNLASSLQTAQASLRSGHPDAVARASFAVGSARELAVWITSTFPAPTEAAGDSRPASPPTTSPPLSHLPAPMLAPAEQGTPPPSRALLAARHFPAHRLRSGSPVDFCSVVTPKEAFFYDGGMLG